MTTAQAEFAKIISGLLDRELPPDVLAVLHAARRMGAASGDLDPALLVATTDIRSWKHLAAVGRGLGVCP